MSATSLALSNLRAIVILIVVGFHSLLAYLSWLPAKQQPFNAPPYDWQAFPIIDTQRWFGFDLFCAWNDVCLMALMFFLSGLFVWPSLKRRQGWGYLMDRVLRLGLPMLLAIYLLMPVAHYPVYLATTADPSLSGFWREFRSLPFWPCGPMWFLWQLLAFNIVIAAVHRLAPQWGEVLGGMTASARTRPARLIVMLIAASAVAYVPLALIYSPWDWFQYGIFAFQYSRPLLNAVYFIAGAAVGAYGLDRGLLAADGALVRHWPIAILGAIVGMGLWMGPMALVMSSGNSSPLWLQAAADFGFVLCCAGGCLSILAVSVRFSTRQRPVLDSLSINAYGMYLVHYPFVVWMQYALLNAALPAIAKAAIVFGVAAPLSWAASAGLGGLPLGARLIGTGPRTLAKAQ